MKNKVKSIIKHISQVVTLPDGIYKGTWSAYVIELKYENEIYELRTEIGVRGINIPVVIEIKEGVATFDTVINFK